LYEQAVAIDVSETNHAPINVTDSNYIITIAVAAIDGGEPHIVTWLYLAAVHSHLAAAIGMLDARQLIVASAFDLLPGLRLAMPVLLGASGSIVTPAPGRFCCPMSTATLGVKGVLAPTAAALSLWPLSAASAVLGSLAAMALAATLALVSRGWRGNGQRGRADG